MMTIHSACLYDDDIWVVASNDAYLYKLSGDKDVLQEVILLSRDEKKQEAFKGIYTWKNFLLIVAMSKNYVVRYDVTTGEKKYYALPFNSEKGTEYNFAVGYVLNDELFLFGWKFPGILRLNLIDGECKIIDEYIDKYKEQVEKEPYGYCTGKCIIE